MTIRYQLSVTTAAGVHCGASRVRGELADTLPYLPGSAVRGAVAMSLLQQVDDDIGQLLEGMRFENLYPEGGVPLPLSARTCSRTPGFLGDGGHGVADLLLALEAAALGGPAGPAPLPAPEESKAAPDGIPDEAASGNVTDAALSGGVAGEAASRGGPEPMDASHADPGRLLVCPRCSGERRRAGAPETSPWIGFVQWDGGQPRSITSRFGAAYIQAAGATRSGRGEALLQRTLAAGRRFAGVVQFNDGQLAARVTVGIAGPGIAFWLGSGRSRGLGVVTVDSWQEAQPADAMPDRLAGLSARLRALCRRSGGLAANDSYATLSLRSPALLRDAFGRFRLSLNGDDLARVLGLPSGSVELRQAMLGSTRIEGWNGTLGLPRPDALALALGSCWLVRFRELEADAIIDSLGRLERDGLGERRQEGFGAVSVCDPLHWQVNELEEDTVA